MSDEQLANMELTNDEISEAARYIAQRRAEKQEAEAAAVQKQLRDQCENEVREYIRKNPNCNRPLAVTRIQQKYAKIGLRI